MHKFLGIFFLLLISFTLLSQESNLPPGNCRIVLKNKTSLKYVKLWKEHDAKIEFERDGSLSDVMKDDVSYIECGREILAFDEKGKMQHYPYGLIIKKSNDTIFCTRLSKEGGFLSYVEKGKDKPVYVSENSIRSYVIHTPEKQQETSEAMQLSKDSVVKTDSAKKDIAVTEKKDEHVVKADSAVKNTPPQEKIISHSPASSNDCDASYKRGVQDAKMHKDASIGWGIGGASSMCFTGGCGFPVLPMMAANSEPKVQSIPSGVQPECYAHGYKHQKTKQNVRAASIGGFVGLGLLAIGILGLQLLGAAGM